MKQFKKIFVIFMIFNVLFISFYEQHANANVVSKPLVMTAKKVAKDLAQESAVAMANEIVSQYLVRELIDGGNVDDGYAAVCMDGAKDNIKDCPVEKRAQVKQTLSSGDRSALANTVEQVLEQKTNTSSKWQKFLDFFIPIFLISGLVATFTAMLDGDSESLIDEIAKESLISSGLLKPFVVAGGGGDSLPIYDFRPYVESAKVVSSVSGNKAVIRLEASLKPNQKFDYTYQHSSYVNDGVARNALFVDLHFYGVWVPLPTKPETYRADGKLSTFEINGNLYTSPNINTVVWTSGATSYADKKTAEGVGAQSALSVNMPKIVDGDINDVMNSFFAVAAPISIFTFSVDELTQTPPEVETDYGVQPGFEKTKNPDGTKTLPGVDSFTYTYNNTNVYPATDSTTGWKDKTTGEDITVVEDEIVIDGGTTPVDPDKPPEEENEFYCTQKMKLPDFKPVSNAFTNAFPFSIPWDIKRAIDAAFGGVGDSKPSFPLPMFGSGVVVTVPDMIDNWMPFLRGFLILMFDVSILFMFYRFMKGGGD